MAQNGSLTDFILKNKVLSAGIFVILLIMLLDSLVFRPMRKRSQVEEQRGKKANVSVASTQSTSSSNTPSQSASNNLTPPAPLSVPVFPELSPNIVNRFKGNSAYPFRDGRNVFKEIEKVEIVEVIKETVEEVISKPDISYHGFFTVGNDRVAILRNSEELLLTKVGNKVRRTNYKLASITPEKVVVTDLSNKIRDFEISLADEAESN